VNVGVELGLALSNRVSTPAGRPDPLLSEWWSYQRLELIDDEARAAAFTQQLPWAQIGQISLLRSANISTENLVHVAVRHNLYRYVRHNVVAIHDNVTPSVIFCC
jgi:hypothetical protein